MACRLKYCLNPDHPSDAEIDIRVTFFQRTVENNDCFVSMTGWKVASKALTNQYKTLKIIILRICPINYRTVRNQNAIGKMP